MKAPQSKIARVLLSLGLMLVAALAVWRLGRPVSSFGLFHIGKAAPSRSSSRPAVAPLEARAETFVSQEADSTAGKQATPFLQGLSARLAGIRSEKDATQQEERLEALAQGIALRELAEALSFLQELETADLNKALRLRL